MKVVSLPVGMIGTNCYLTAAQNGDTAIIDPGAQPDQIKEVLQKNNLTPKMILLTHGHFDHIGAADALRKEFEIPLYLHQADADMVGDSDQNGGIGLIGKHITCGWDHLLSDGDIVELNELTFQVIHTPGNTKGSVCYAVEDVLFTGDTLFCGGIGRTDLYGGSYRELCDSLKKLAALEKNYRVYPGHDRTTTLDAEKQQNPYLGKMSYDDII